MSAVTAWDDVPDDSIVSIASEAATLRSFDEFYASTRDGVVRALTLTLADAELAHEAVDEAMVRAYQRWDRVGILENPGGWVYRVGLNWARSRVRQVLRASRRRVEHVPHADMPSVGEPVIDEAMSRLSIDHRSVVVCRYLLGWSEATTAEMLRIRPGTVKSRLHRATQQLQHDLADLRPPARRPAASHDTPAVRAVQPTDDR